MKLVVPVIALLLTGWAAAGNAQVRECDHVAEQSCLNTTLVCIARSCPPEDRDSQDNVQCRSRCYVDKGKCLRQAGCLD